MPHAIVIMVLTGIPTHIGHSLTEASIWAYIHDIHEKVRHRNYIDNISVAMNSTALRVTRLERADTFCSDRS